jgi:hypothetical protein
MKMPHPQLELVCNIEVELGPIRELGQGRGGARRRAADYSDYRRRCIGAAAARARAECRGGLADGIWQRAGGVGHALCDGDR